MSEAAVNPDACCGKLERCYATELIAFAQLNSRVQCIAISPNRLDAFYRCNRCGQVWEEQTNPFHRVGHVYVLKSFMDARGNPRPLAYDHLMDEIRLLDTNEVIAVKKSQPPTTGCLWFGL